MGQSHLVELSRRTTHPAEDTTEEALLMARVAHDLRSPLTAVKTSVGVLRANVPADFPESLGRMLRHIDLASDQMADVIADGCELALLQAGRADLELEMCDLGQLLERVTPVLERLAGRRSQVIVVKPPREVIAILADSRRLARVMANLGAAVMRRAYEGETITFALVRDRASACLTVDTGVGRETSVAQVGAESAGGGEMDLGFQVARGILELHGGTVSATLNAEEPLAICARLPLRPGAGPSRIYGSGGRT